MTYTSVGKGKVSIVIPCYNYGAMLREALASVKQVRNANLLEVIIVDDGSSDAETRHILSEAERRATALYLSLTADPGAARNTGIRLAKGEFILPLDSDNRLRDVYLNEGVFLLKAESKCRSNLLGRRILRREEWPVARTRIRFIIVDPGKLHRYLCSLPKEVMGRSWRIR